MTASAHLLILLAKKRTSCVGGAGVDPAGGRAHGVGVEEFLSQSIELLWAPPEAV